MLSGPFPVRCWGLNDLQLSFTYDCLELILSHVDFYWTFGYWLLASIEVLVKHFMSKSNAKEADTPLSHFWHWELWLREASQDTRSDGLGFRARASNKHSRVDFTGLVTQWIPFEASLRSLCYSRGIPGWDLKLSRIYVRLAALQSWLVNPDYVYLGSLLKYS